MNETDVTDWVPIGLHSARFEAPDLLCTRAVGVISGPEVVELSRLIVQWTKDLPVVYWIAEISQFEHYSGAAVRAASTHAQGVISKTRAIVYVGGNYRQRAAISVVLKAMELLRMVVVVHVPEIAFLDSEDEARAFMDKVRQRQKSVAP